MKTTIWRYGVMFALLGLAPSGARAEDRTCGEVPPCAEIHGDSLTRLCDGALPLYGWGDRLLLAVPEGPVRVVAQIDRGGGMRNRALRCVPQFRMAMSDGALRLVMADTLAAQDFSAASLPVYGVSGSARRLADITDCIRFVGGWYAAADYLLRGQTPGGEELLEAAPRPGGTLVRMRVNYLLPSISERGVEIQLPSGSVPVDLSLLLTCSDREVPPVRELAVAGPVSGSWRGILDEAVAAYNRAHRRQPLRLVEGGDTVRVDRPYAVTFDAVDRRIDTFVGERLATGEAVFGRIQIGAAGWSREALACGLRQARSYGALRKLLSDEALRRREAQRAAVDAALRELFGPPQDASEMRPDRELKRLFRESDRRIALRERFLRNEERMLLQELPDGTGGEIYRAILAENRSDYVALVRETCGTPWQREAVVWVADAMRRDAAGRFDGPMWRAFGIAESPTVQLRRCRAVWESLFAEAEAASFGMLAAEFRRALAQPCAAAYVVQDACVDALSEAVGSRPRLSGLVSELLAVYGDLSGSQDAQTALFAKMQSERLHEIRIEECSQN